MLFVKFPVAVAYVYLFLIPFVFAFPVALKFSNFPFDLYAVCPQ